MDFALRPGNLQIDRIGVLTHSLGYIHFLEEEDNIGHARVMMVPMMIMVVVMMVLVILIMVMVMMVFMILIMVMMVMLMIMNILGFFLFPLHFDHHMRSRDSALYSRFLFHRNTRDQGVHFFKKGLFLFIGKKFQECSREHIASSTHSAFNVQCLHVDCLRFSVCLLL